jgi:hypothetical protein
MCGLCDNSVLLIKIECRHCFLIFYLCRRCYRGHAYCGDQCRAIARREAHRIDQSKYRTSDKGRKANRLAARKRRMKQTQKSVADRGTISPPKDAMIPPFSSLGKIACLFCCRSGIVVARFPRRGYRPASLDRDRFFRKDEDGLVQSNLNDRRHHEYWKNIRPKPNSPDP